MTGKVAPVEVTNVEPIPVEVAARTESEPQTTARSVAAKAGVEANALTTEGQRRINLIWERTQAIIAISVVVTALLVIGVLVVVPVLRGGVLDPTAVTGVVLLSGLVTNVTTSYFTRTNHSKVGGVGASDDSHR